MIDAIDVARAPMLAAASLSVARGELVGLVGPNGAGKTTLLRALAGISDGPGSVRLDGAPIEAMHADERARRLAYMPAVRRVDWPMAVRDVVALGLAGAVDDPAARIDAVLELVDMQHMALRRVDRLSTGERARVLLGRALIGDPQALLLDEPVANLDPHYQLQIMQLLRARANAGAAIITAIHDLALAERVCDRLIVIDKGSIVADGPASHILDRDLLARVFRVARGADGWTLLA